MLRLILLILIIAVLWSPVTSVIEQYQKGVDLLNQGITAIKTQDNIFSGWVADIKSIDFSLLGQKKPVSECSKLNQIITSPKPVKAASFNAPNLIENHCISLKPFVEMACIYTCQTNPIQQGYGTCWWKRKPCNVSSYLPPSVKIQNGW